MIDTRLNVLLLLAPASWILAAVQPASPWLFVVAAAYVVLGIAFYLVPSPG